MALDKGYYKAKGLDVTLENSKGSGDLIAKVDTGRADAGLADAAVVIASIGRGTTIKTVGMVFDKTPLNIFSLKEQAAHQAQGPRGQDLGAPPGDSQRQMFPAFAKVNGIDVSKVSVGEHRAGGQDRRRRREAHGRRRRLLDRPAAL